MLKMLKIMEKKEKNLQVPGTVVHAVIPALRRQVDCENEESLGYIARYCLKKENL
jgi:hypothetical protein